MFCSRSMSARLVCYWRRSHSSSVRCNGCAQSIIIGQRLGAPNFAFDLCVQRFRADQMTDLDLSCWKLAFNAAEPVRADTIERFAATFSPYGFEPRVMYPLYGMAEATLLISAGRRGAGPIIRTVSRDAFQRHQIAAPVGRDDAHRVVGCGRNIIGQ